MEISVIIPTLNEAGCIERLITHLQSNLKSIAYEIIVADGCSSDDTRLIAERNGAVVLKCDRMSRAAQMNQGAEIAKGDILYFVHADTLPPSKFYDSILKAFNQGYGMGCFRFKFDSNRLLLKINSYFTRFDRMMFRGGDQTLFIRRESFESIGGYKDEYRIMEEYEFIRRARKKLKFRIIPRDVLVSARKYEENSYFRVNFANLVVFTLFKNGASQERMIKAYRNLLHHPKSESLA